MKNALTIVARIEAKQDSVDLVKSELNKLITPTRAEAGCLQYDLHQDNDQPHIFLFFENWESRPLWQDHMKSEHLKTMKDATADAIENVTINEMSQIG